MVSYIQSLLANFVLAFYCIRTWPPKEKINFFLFPAPLGQTCFVLVLISRNHKARNRYPEIVMARTVGFYRQTIARQFSRAFTSYTNQIRFQLPWTSPHHLSILCKEPAFHHLFRTFAGKSRQTTAKQGAHTVMPTREPLKYDTFSFVQTLSVLRIQRTETEKMFGQKEIKSQSYFSRFAFLSKITWKIIFEAASCN